MIFLLDSSQHWVHTKVKSIRGHEFLLTCIYGPPRLNDRHKLWDFLNSIDNIDNPWVIGGFKQVILSNKKLRKVNKSLGIDAICDTLFGIYRDTIKRKSLHLDQQ